tara:strand:+ start:294 stop:566 length:273 start_codon:yes stop_codon:yes gene_type:complete
MGKYRNAILCYNKVLKQDPKEMNAVYYKSKSTARQNDEKQTCKLVAKLLKFDSSHDHDHDHMGFLEKIQKDSDFKKMKKNANFLFMLKHN